MNWGKGIILSFGLFAAFVIILVTICFRQDVNLVSKDYYQKELHFQDQIDRMNNTALLTVQPILEMRNGSLTIDFQQTAGIEHGEIQFFRPSDIKLDRKFSITSSKDKVHVFSLAGMPSGMYKLRMNWSIEGTDYFMEKTIRL